MASNKLQLESFTRNIIIMLEGFWGILLVLTGIMFFSYKHSIVPLPLMLYWGGSLFWTLLISSKDGANINYFAEWAVLSLIIIVIGLSSSARILPRPVAVVLLGVLILHVGMEMKSLILGEINSVNRQMLPEDSTRDITPYVSRYRKESGEKLILHERIAVHVGNPQGLDWYLATILNEQKRIDITPYLYKIFRGEYHLIVFSNKYDSGIERLFKEAVTSGPYIEKYRDYNVVEYVKI